MDNGSVDVPRLAFALCALAWAVVLADLARQARRRGIPALRRLSALVLVAVLVGAAAALEVVTGGRLGWHPAMAAAGVCLAWCGVALHVWARRTIGAGWSPRIDPGPGAPLVERGPYARVRHPLYLAILLLAAGSLLAHPSRATIDVMLGLAVGVAVKRRAEERVLAGRFGARWQDYAARVPALWPRLIRGRPRAAAAMPADRPSRAPGARRS